MFSIGKIRKNKRIDDGNNKPLKFAIEIGKCQQFLLYIRIKIKYNSIAIIRFFGLAGLFHIIWKLKEN